MTDANSMCGYPAIHAPSLSLSLSLCLSAVLPTRPFFLFHINMTTAYIFDYFDFDNKRLRTVRYLTWGLAYTTSYSLLVMS